MATDVDSLGPLHQIELPEGPIAYHERGNGPPLVFVHGIIANADVWRHLLPARRAKNITMTTAAAHLHVWPARIGELERGQLRNDDLVTAYRTWLSAA